MANEFNDLTGDEAVDADDIRDNLSINLRRLPNYQGSYINVAVDSAIDLNFPVAV